MLVVGGDSHSPTGGAFGAYMFGVGATEMAGVLATGEIWLRVPETIRIEWSGRCAQGVAAKDMMLFLCTKLGMSGGGYQAVEFAGSAIRGLTMQERMTLSNMTAELGGQAGLIEPDEVTIEYLNRVGATVADASERWRSDPDAPVSEHLVFDAAALAPQVAAPHSPANSADVSAFSSQPIQVAYIGACTGAKLVDLRMAAAVLKGRKTAPGVSLLVAPASRRDQEEAAQEGTLRYSRGSRRKTIAECLRNMRRLRRCAAWRRRGLHLVHGAQFQRQDGRALFARVSRLSVHGRGLGGQRADR